MVQNNNSISSLGKALAFEDQETRFRSLDDWFNSSHGIHVGESFSAELSHLKEFLHGETLVQLGHCGDNAWLKLLNYHFKWVIAPNLKPAAKDSLRTSFTQLPFARDSIDCVIAPLTLDAFTRQKNPIDEMDRILKPMGYAVFFGINPLSLWGIFLRLGRLPCFDRLSGRPMSALFVKRAMLHRGYIQHSFSSFYYIPPVTQEKWVHKLEVLNGLGKVIWPCPSAFYCLVMQKYQENQSDILLEKIEEKILPIRSIPIQPAC